ncbi:type II methionyl aminopeptidase [Candidatus Pacearchaeota archaeon CG_4_9_14_0_2_um_filter_39_13]|nr:type II methionyl aminopeptidase [Candidatus Pacearchaeota archaeon]OIO43089.1 MAG: type II methionyl aminopeptidase [Candidatus Pacearchaeota archaeon CG1_02_39_14]PJC44629.1 MAG: type II methionyl aminopeptidase [Candidatus Pacearchaeota archaeon CG_4_9_14_0_2_um_filter_39_13]
MDTEKIIEAGKIAREVVAYAKSIIKSGMKLIEIADSIDAKILELGGKPAFPVNLSVDDVAAHSTPAWNDDSVASGLLKVDIGVHVDGWCADTAFTVDLESDEENKRLIEAAESALDLALEEVNKKSKLRGIGKKIEEGIKSKGFSPVVNLSGHSIDRYELHAGLTIPNVDNGNENEIGEGLFAIEPFTTNGIGKVKDGKPSGIYHLQSEGNVRDSFAREVLAYIKEEYNTLPFCSRWIYKKFSSRGMLALRQMKQSGILYEYPQLIEAEKGRVAQAEHTVLINKDGKKITTSL